MYLIHATSVFPSQRNNIASSRFWAILGKVLAHTPVIVYRKKKKGGGKLTQLMKGLSSYAALLLRKQPTFKRCSPFCGWLLYEPRKAPPWFHLFWSRVEHSCKQFACAPRPTQPFTRCSITCSSCDLTVPLHHRMHKHSLSAFVDCECLKV